MHLNVLNESVVKMNDPST